MGSSILSSKLISKIHTHTVIQNKIMVLNLRSLTHNDKTNPVKNVTNFICK